MTPLPPVPAAWTPVSLAAEMVHVSEADIRAAIADGRLQVDMLGQVDMRDVMFIWDPDRTIE